MQKAVQQFSSECGRVNILVENEMPIGVFHDFLMQIKGLMVERMVQAHNEQLEQAKAMKEVENKEEESSDCCNPKGE